MIVKMKKYSFLIFHSEYEAFLKKMRSLGVLHIIERPDALPEEQADLQQMQADEARLEKTARQLQSRAAGKGVPAVADVQADGAALLERYEALQERKNRAVQQQASLQKEIERMRVWGEFEFENLQRLEAAGYVLHFYSIGERLFRPEWSDEQQAVVVGKEGTTLYFVALSRSGETPDFEGAEPVRLSDRSLRRLREELESARADERESDVELDRFALRELYTLRKAIRQQRERYEYARALTHTNREAGERVMVLEGWVPVTKEAAVNAYLEQAGICYVAAEPDENENAPVLLKNNAFTRLFESIGELYDMPNYHELDLTPFFAPFFVMFFGLCLGDAGYGLLITIAALVAKRKVKPSLKPFMGLAFWLGLGTVVFGLFSGTLFGIPLLSETTGPDGEHVARFPWMQGIAGYIRDSGQMFNFALMVGAFQIIFGMVLRAVSATRRYGFLRSLSHWGWLVLILGCGTVYALHRYEQISSETAKTGYLVVVGVAALGIFLFNDVKRNPLVNIGAGIWDSYNMATGLLGDLLSYIRLFALGISGAVMGLVFNDLALSLTESMPVVVSQIVMVLILLFGHSMNIFMSGLGAFVHPMRLTFVEFYKNAGFEGGGKKYRPFREETGEE